MFRNEELNYAIKFHFFSPTVRLIEPEALGKSWEKWMEKTRSGYQEQYNLMEKSFHSSSWKISVSHGCLLLHITISSVEIKRTLKKKKEFILWWSVESDASTNARFLSFKNLPPEISSFVVGAVVVVIFINQS